MQNQDSFVSSNENNHMVSGFLICCSFQTRENGRKWGRLIHFFHVDGWHIKDQFLKSDVGDTKARILSPNADHFREALSYKPEHDM